jgi:5-methyltetrahydropteroyltriglutamate--homocysteine methyltransferase
MISRARAWAYVCQGEAGLELGSVALNSVADLLGRWRRVDGYFLEYDDERSGGFAPLRFLPKDKKVVLGLVSSKFAKLESEEALKRRIDEAAKVVPLEQLAISPQCGFSSTAEGNIISLDDERKN